MVAIVFIISTMIRQFLYEKPFANFMRVLYLFLLLIFVSCGSNHRDSKNKMTSYDWHGKEVLLNAVDSIKVDTVIDYIMSIYPINDVYLVEYPYDWALFIKEDNILKFKSFLLKKGNGPSEVLSSARFARLNDGRFFLGECIGSEKMFVSITDSLTSVEDISLWNVNKRDGANPFYFESLQPVNENIIIGGVQGENASKFVAYNIEQEQYYNLNDNYFFLYDELLDFERSFAMEGFLLKKPDDNKYLFTTTVGLNSIIFDCCGESITNEKIIYQLPASFKSSGEKGKRPKLTDGQTAYNVSPAVTRNYIYMSDRQVTVEDVFGNKPQELPYNFTKDVVVFDWDATPLCKYLLDKPIRSMFVDNDDSTLYGIAVGDNNYDLILEYRLKAWN